MTAADAGRGATPTVDLYMLNALGAPQWLRRRAPTVYETDSAVVVFRHDRGARIAPRDPRRLIYVLDDAVFAGVLDQTLPAWYRAKLALTECAAARRLAPRADVLVVSAPEVAEALPARLRRSELEIAAITPYWREPASDLTHHDAGEPLKLAFSGAQTHSAGLRLAAPAAAAVLKAHPDATLHLAVGHRPPRPLRGHPRLRREGGSWPTYRAALPGMTRHVALYPTPDTPFARARSINKLIEHARFGAAPIYAETWSHAAQAVAANAGVAAPATPEAWTEAAVALASDPAKARRIAEAAIALAARLNDPKPQQDLWMRLLR